MGAEVNLPTEEDDTLFKFNASYDIDDDMMIYTTIAEGYRRGGANAVPLNGDLEERPEWQQYNSDSVTNFEVGVKGSFGDGNHNYTASVFLMDWDDPQLNTATAWGFFAVANGESAQTQGIELELSGFLNDDWHYSVGYAHVSAELTADFYAPSAVWVTDPLSLVAEDGDKLPTTPDDTLSVGLDYTHNLANGMYLTTRVNGYYQSDSLNALGADSRVQADIDGFSLWNFSTRLSSEGSSDWDIALYVKNIFNEEGVTGLIPEGYMGTDPAENFLGNSSKNYISLPRTIGVSATFHF